MHTANATKTVSVQIPDGVDDCSFSFIHQNGAWYCQVTSAQGMGQYPVAGNITGAQATALAAIAAVFMGLYQTDAAGGKV